VDQQFRYRVTILSKNENLDKLIEIIKTYTQDIQDSAKVIERVDTFIKNMQDLVYVFNRSKDSDEDILILLSQCLTKYELYKEDAKLTNENAAVCLSFINATLSLGIIKEGQGSISKLKDCTEKNIALENELLKISEDYDTLKHEYEDLKLQSGYVGNNA
jgi:hypothetical protein